MNRSIWYLCSSFRYTAAATAAEPTTARKVMNRGGTPATTIIAATVRMMMMAVPRSGCRTIMTSGTPPITRMRTTSYIARPSGRR